MVALENHDRQFKESIGAQSPNLRTRHQAQEKLELLLLSTFTSEWLRKWRDTLKPITYHLRQSKRKAIDTKLKIHSIENFILQSFELFLSKI